MARVLIVEDEPHIAEALVFLLEREGFSPIVVTDGDSAIAALEGTDLLILDVMLPGRSGFEIAAAVREMEHPPKTCVLTAKGQAADRERMNALGVDAFVTKPFSNRALMDTVRALLAEA
ncbi:response regulator transcription factor [Acuticoccus mangrovi]|uniref:Response regulator transcription factor n=1 Tax=Acuticoccus mangrovi TaxID=2796142 RepID=A0A934IKQ2_9HYPH|nr:response regulator transcription factor [Acuticoccus mangrovi]MBJ3774098.1 response regulator transcription factor [Acuticoccus mangrovi]